MSTLGHQYDNSLVSNAFGFLRLPMNFMPYESDADWVITGVPFDMATSGRAGGRHGPAAIRQVSTNLAWEHNRFPWNFDMRERLNVVDCGDLVYAFGDAREMSEKLQAHAEKLLAAGKRMLSFGGDHFVTLPLLLALVHWIAPSVRALSHSSLKLQLQFGVIPLLSYVFDYFTRIYTDLLSSGNQAAVEFMPFVCSLAYLVFVLQTTQEQKLRSQLEQTQNSLNLAGSAGCARDRCPAGKPAQGQHLPPRPAPSFTVHFRLHRKWPCRSRAGIHPQRVRRDRSQQGERLL